MKKKENASGPALTPEAIQAKEFRVARFGGYRMHDVDEFLDQVTVALQEALQRKPPMGAANAAIGAPDLQEVGRQADEIIARAKQEAARILAQAERAAATASAPDRTSIAPYLERERDFLQSIAGLVQEHAEAIKAMARAQMGTRAVGDRTVKATVSGPQGEPSRQATTADEKTERRSEPIRRGEPAQAPSPPREKAGSVGAAEAGSSQQRVRSEGAGSAVDPASTAHRSTPADLPAPAAVADRSLRELFWEEE